jgi:ComF family protein
LFVSAFGTAAEGLFTVLFPSDCRICGTPLVKISRLPVCEECIAEMQPIRDPVCGVCGERLPGRYVVEDRIPRCFECRQLEPLFAKAVAYGTYDLGLRELIHLLKYEQVRPAAGVLGRMLAEAIEGLAPALLAVSPVVVPVPLHREKLRQRGFNQSELIAQAALKIGFASREWRLDAAVLERVRPTESQTGLTRPQRIENLRGAFAVRRDVAGKQVLLVDDVFTTGTTAGECARALRRAGASCVWVATVARVLRVEAAFQEISVHDGEEKREQERSKAIAAGV